MTRRDDLIPFIPLLRHLSREVRLRPGSILERSDLVDAAYVELLEVLPRFDASKGTLVTFVGQHARWAMVNEIRRVEHTPRCPSYRAAHPVFVGIADAADVPASSCSTCESAERADVGSRVRKTVATQLSRARAHMVTEHCMRGRTAASVASDLGISENWVFQELKRAKELLAPQLEGLR